MTGSRFEWEVRRPAGWLRVTDDPEADLQGVDVPASGRDRLEQDLERVRARAREDGAPDRRHWAFVPDATKGAVLATMSCDVLRRGAASMQELADAMSAAPPPVGSQVWHRDIALRRLPNGTAASGLELILVPSEGGDEQIIERYRGMLATPTPGIVLQLSLSTYDLALFADIVAYGDEVMGAISFDVAGRAA